MRRLVHVKISTEFYEMLERERLNFQKKMASDGVKRKITFVELTRLVSKPKFWRRFFK